MTIRPYKPEDFEQIKAIHADRDYEFELPDLSSSDMASIWVAVEGEKVVSMVAARKTVEVVAIVDPNYANPAWRLETICRLQERGAIDLREQGFTDMHSWVKPSVRGFARRLVRSLGWIRSSGGDCFVRSV